MKRTILLSLFWLIQITLFAQSGYKLTLESQPVGAVSFSTDVEEIIEEGTQVYRYCYTNGGYVFDCWLADGDTLSTNRSVQFTMPAHDVKLIAVCHYDPTNPADPDMIDKQFTVTLESQPTGIGSFSWNTTTRVTPNTEQRIYAYNSGGYLFSEWQLNGATVSKEQGYSFTMPEENITLVAIYEFNPSSPDNPLKNHWNADEGVVIVDDFQPGRLSYAVSEAANGNDSKVQTIIVAGPINQSDWGVANSFPNCTILDLSRTYGMTYVPSWNFSYNTTLTKICLPSSIERIEYNAFMGCTALNVLNCHATTPPVVVPGAFDGVQGLVVHVPANSVALYQEADVWKDFTILPLEEEVSALEVNFPAGVNMSDYKDMFIELVSITNGQILRYVVTERTTYTFNSLIHRTSYAVRLVNSRGDILGVINNIDIVDNDVSVTFSNLLSPQNINLQILTPDNVDVTDEVVVTWTDANGAFLAKNNTLDSQVQGSKVTFSIALPQSLGIQYIQPQDSTYTVLATGNDIKCLLAAIPQTTMTGQVLDMKTSLPLSGATVAVSQTLNGQYSKTQTTKTDGQGRWSMEVYDAPTEISASMTDYVSQSLSLERPISEIPVFQLKDISGTTISINLTYTTTDGNTVDYYSDYTNVAYAVYDAATGQQITDLNIQYPQIVLMEQHEEGTAFRIVATSKNQKFESVETTATVDSLDRATVTLPIKQLGGIVATFSQAVNTGVVGILYDAKGNLLKKYNYATATLTISELHDGDYTLVTMGNSALFNSIYSLSQFAESGLTKDTDYVLNNVTVASGEMAEINNDLIPLFDESRLYYTGSGTSFTVNKSEVTAGQYLTLSSRLDFKPDITDQVSDVQLIVNLPENSSLVDNSVMVGNSTSGYTYADHVVTIPLANYADRVRFCIIPSLGGEYNPTASVQFVLDGESITQPIGNVNFEVKNLTINVPSIVAKKTVPVSGMAAGKSSVEIYDNGTLVGQSTTNGNGYWIADVELNEAYNLSTHEIYAKLTTEGGMEMLTDSKFVSYIKDAIEAKNVNMSFYNSWMHKTISVNFNLLNGTNDVNSYSFYNATEFTFVVDFTKNDTTLVKDIELYVLTNDGNVSVLYPKFSNSIGKFVASKFFNSEALPKNVSVSFTALSPLLADSKLIEDAQNEIVDIDSGFRNDYDMISLFFDNNEDVDYNDYSILCSQLGISCEINESFDNDDSIIDMSESEIEAYTDSIDTYITESLSSIQDELDIFRMSLSFDSYSNQIYNNGYQITFNDINGLEESSLIEDGFYQVPLDNGSFMYIRTTNVGIDIINFDEQLYMHVSMPDNNVLSTLKKRGSGPLDDFMATYEKISFAIKVVNDLSNDFLVRLRLPVDKLNKQIAKLEVDRLEVLRIKDCMCKPGSKNHIKWTKRLKSVDRTIALLRVTLKWTSPLLRILARSVPFVDYLHTLHECWKISEELEMIYTSIPDPCLNDEENALACKVLDKSILVATALFAIADVITEVTADVEIATGAAAAVTTGGASLAVTGMGLVQKAVAQIGKYAITAATKYYGIEELKKNVNKLKCYNNGNMLQSFPKPTTPDMGIILDPSGFVYEAIPANRVEGATASIYYKEEVEDMYGVKQDNVVLWNAEEYAQKNPLFTDENGMYQWDVPQGLWQVKFEKEGYETAYSEWLPVPPPQLDVNVELKQNKQPEVKMAHAYEDAVEVEFDKYMMPELLTTNSIKVMANGQNLEGTIELLDEAAVEDDDTKTFASKLRFNAAQPFDAEEITLFVNNQVKSYAGIRMQDDYLQTFTVEPEIKEIVCEPNMLLGYGDTISVTVDVLPVKASAGKTLMLKSSSPVILSTLSESVVIGEDGKATFRIGGELPGTAGLTYTVDGYDITATTTVNVSPDFGKVTATPVSNIVSGSLVSEGTFVTLTCSTQGATIYYTLDGSCPCDETKRIVYDGTPIVVDRNVVVKAIAVAPNMEDSKIMNAVYIVLKGDVNNDKRVGIGDIVAVTSFVAGDAVGLPMEIADVNRDGKVGIGDVIAITNIVAGNTYASPKHRTYMIKNK